MPGGRAFTTPTTLVVVLSLVNAVLGASPQQPTQQGASISGRIIDASTGAPIAGALVEWQNIAVVQPGPGMFRAQTGADGRFTFADLDAATYVIRSELAGYENGNFGNAYVQEGFRAQLSLQRGEHVDIVIKMWRSGVISGTVFEQGGQPGVGLSIQTLRRQGTRWLSTGRGASSDDRGRYRMSVPPGEYLVLVQANSGANKTLLHTTYAPAASTSSTAVPVKVQSGSETNVDLRVDVEETPGMGRRIAGAVSAPDGNIAGLEVRLTPVSAGATAMYDQRTVRTDAKGLFEFRGISEGEYTVRVVRFPDWPATDTGYRTTATAMPNGFSFGRAPAAGQTSIGSRGPSPTPPGTTMAATVAVTVADRDRANVEIALVPAARFRCRVIFDGADAPTQNDLLAISPMVLPADDTYLPNVPQGRVEADGTFQSIGLPPGRYSVGLFSGLPRGWTLASVEQGGKNVTGQAIELGTADVDLVLTYTRKTTVLAGSVRDSQGRPAPSGRVYVFPQEPALRVVAFPLSPLVQQAQSSPNGPFEFKQMLPGDYLVAYTSDPPEDWSVPGFLQSLERTAVPVHINLGETKTIELRIP